MKRRGFDSWIGKTSTGAGNGNSLWYSCLENSMNRGAWQATQSTEPRRVGHNWATKHTDKNTEEFRDFNNLPEVTSRTKICNQFSSVQSLSRVWLFATPWITARQTSLSITNSRSSLNSCPSSRWCHPAISSSVIPFSSCPQSLPASGSFPVSQLFAWGGQSIGVSALASVLPMNTQGWSPSEWTGWISLQSKGLSRVSSNTTLQKHQFFCTQLSL